MEAVQVDAFPRGKLGSVEMRVLMLCPKSNSG